MLQCVVENFNKQLYVYGENWGRGTEILYQEMKLKMPEKVKEKALKEGYYALSTEVLPEFAGDYLIVSKTKILITHSKRQNHIKTSQQ